MSFILAVHHVCNLMAWKSFSARFFAPSLVLAFWPVPRAVRAGNRAATIVRAILADDDAQKRELIGSLIGQGDEAIRELFTAWRQDAPLCLHGARRRPRFPSSWRATRMPTAHRRRCASTTASRCKDADGKPLRLAASRSDRGGTRRQLSAAP